MEKPEQFNLTELETLSGGDKSFILKMLETFSVSVPPYIEKMKEAMASKSFPELSNIAHRLRPSFHYLGRSDLNGLLVIVENGNGKNSHEDILGAAEKFLKDSALMMVEVDGHIEKLKTT